jgi:hypothetical protein
MRPTLAETQRYLWRLITAPEGVAAGLAAMADEDPRLASRLDEIVRADERLSAVERLDVYANMYFFRLLDSLKEDYPALLAVAGEPEFHNLITDYLLARPSSHWSLRYAGEGVPQFIRTHSLARERPWLAALAELEWAILDVFDAADGATLAAADLAPVAAADWPSIRFVAASGVRLLELGWRVDEVWQRAQDGEAAGEPERRPTAFQVWRRDLRVYHRPLEPLEADCLRLLLAGEPFAAWCEHAAAAIGEEEAAMRVAAFLQRWLAEGIVASMCVPPAADD